MASAARQLLEAMSLFGIEVDPEQIVLIKGGMSKHDALDKLISAMCKHPYVKDGEAFRKAVFERESVMSTGIGGGVAIPHVRIPEITHPTVGVGVAPKGLEFGTLDNKPVHIMVLFATPEGADKEYLSLLAQVMLALKDEKLFDAIVQCRTAQQVYDVLHDS